jgi:YD repeat-containing protein
MRRRTVRDEVGFSWQVSTVLNARNETTTFSYNLAGQQTKRELANSTRVSQTFDPAGQLDQLSNLLTLPDKKGRIGENP